MGFPLGTSPYGAPRWVGSMFNKTHPTLLWLLLKTQAKRPHIECDSDNDVHHYSSRFIILESKEKLSLTKTSPFIIEKSISALITPKTVKNLKNGIILIEVKEKKQAEIILKQKKIHNIDIKAYPHERLNTSKRVIRSGELSLCSIMEIKNELKKTKCNRR